MEYHQQNSSTQKPKCLIFLLKLRVSIQSSYLGWMFGKDPAKYDEGNKSKEREETIAIILRVQY